MGEILSSRIAPNGRVIFEVAMPYNEALDMGGQMSKVHLFAEDQMKLKSRLTRRGKNEATTYLLVPQTVRSVLPEVETSRPARVICSETEDKIFLIFSIQKKDTFTQADSREVGKRNGKNAKVAGRKGRGNRA